MNNYDKNVIEIPNFISLNHQNTLENYVCNSNFKWSYYEGTILKTDIQYTNSCVIEKGLNPPQFSHFVNINHNSNIIFVRPILDSLSTFFNKNLQIMKCKFNLLTQKKDSLHHYPHSDLDYFDGNVYTALYYINDSDGETYLFNEFAPKIDNNVSIHKKVVPEKGKILIFDSRRFHASSSPQNCEVRLVLNIVFGVV